MLSGMKFVRVLAVAAAAVTLTGCVGMSPRTAATVNGTQIAQATIDRTVQQSPVLQVGFEQVSVSGPGVVNAYVRGAIATKLAAEHGIVIGDAERAEVLNQNQVVAVLASHPGSREVMAIEAETIIIRKKVGPQRWAQACQDAEVNINPRYGVWISTQCEVSGGGSITAPVK